MKCFCRSGCYARPTYEPPRAPMHDFVQLKALMSFQKLRFVRRQFHPNSYFGRPYQLQRMAGASRYHLSTLVISALVVSGVSKVLKEVWTSLRQNLSFTRYERIWEVQYLRLNCLRNFYFLLKVAQESCCLSLPNSKSLVRFNKFCLCSLSCPFVLFWLTKVCLRGLPQM